MESHENEQHSSSSGNFSETREKLDKIISTLRNLHGKLRRRRNLFLLFVPLSLLLVGATILFYAESSLYLSATTKSISWLVLLAACGAVAWYLRHQFPVPDFTRFYRKLTYQTGLPKLQYALDLQRFPRNESSVFHETAIKENIGSIEAEDLQFRYKQYLRSRPEYSYFQYALGGLFMSTALLLLATTSIGSGMIRGVQFWHGFQRPNPFQFTIQPGNQTIEQGASFKPTIRFTEDQIPDRVTLGIKTDIESKFRLRPMRPEGEQTFVSGPINLTSDARYFVKMGNYSSEKYTIDVQLRPRFSRLKAVVDPPEYTGLDSTHRQYPFSRLETYPGSEITLRGVTNKPLTRLQLLRSQGQRDTLLPKKSDASVYQHQFTVTSADTIEFVMRDSSGLSNDNPFRFTIKTLADERPFVRILQPDSTLKKSKPDSLRLVYEGGDDFGLIRSQLHYELHEAFVEKPKKKKQSIPKPSGNETHTYQWDLTDLQLKPRDKIIYWISVTDNDAVHGYKTVKSRKMTLTVPSMAEYASKLEKEEESVQQSMEDVAQSFQQMSDEYKQFKEQMKRNPTGNWQQQKKLKKVREEQKEFQKKVEELNKKFKKVKKELKKNNMLSEETRKAYKELQKLMKNIDSPELREALKELQKAVKKMNQNQLEKALKNFEFQEKSYKEQLERTLKLFKKLKLNSDLEKMAKSFNSLSKQEQKMSKSSSPPSEKIKKQQAIKKDAKQLSSQIDSLSEQAPSDAKQKMQQLEKQLKKQMQSLQKKMNQNMQEMRKSGNSKKSRSQQKQLQKQMKQMANKMRQSKSQMNQKRMQVNIGALQQILSSLMNVSESQEELTRETEILESGSRGFVEKARKQKNIERQFNRLADSLVSVASDIPMLSSRIMRKKNRLQQRIDRSVEHLSERNKSNSIMAERQVLGGINELSSMLASLIDKLKKMSKKGRGQGQGNMSMQQMIKKMKQMSGKQQQLNKMMQKMINQMQGNRLSKSQIQRMKQLARQQNKIRKQLKQMQKQGGLEPGDKLLSQMQRLNEEMEKTIRDLRGGDRDQKLLRRQKNILSRMLNAKDAMNKRNKSKKRKARQPEENYEQTSPQLTMEELQKKIRQRLQDPQYTEFAQDYQQLIEAYFKLLEKRRN